VSTRALPLDGIVVIDITRVVAGPYCAQMLADLGARVIKVEHPSDPDYVRSFPPRLHDAEGRDAGSGYFAQYNRHKLGVSLDLKQAEGKQLLRDVDALAEAAALDVAQRGQRADGGVERCRQIAEDAAHTQRRLASSAVHRPQAAGGLRGAVVCGAQRVRALMAVAADAGVDQPWIQRLEHRPAEAELVHRAGPEVLDQHVGLGRQLAQQLLALGVLEVEAHALLVPVVLREVAAAGITALGVAQARREAAHVVGIARVLDLDHPRAEVGEHLRAVGAGHHAGDVDDGDAVQRKRSRAHALLLHQPPLPSQSSTCSSRSLPQNGSPSTKKNGEPNTPRASEAATASRRSARAWSPSMPSSSVAASTPIAGPSAATCAGAPRSWPSRQ
jgi:hypothetical protein